MNKIIIREMNEKDRNHYGVRTPPTKEEIRAIIETIHIQYIMNKIKET